MILSIHWAEFMLTEPNENVWWVEFIPESGKITRISSKVIGTKKSRKVLESTSRLLLDISRGKRTRRDFKVFPGVADEEWVLVDSHEDVMLPSPGRWRKVEIGSPFTSAMHLELFLEENRIDIRVNRYNLSTELNQASITELQNNPMYSLDFYLIEDNNPDRLVSIISVDKDKLLSYNKISVEVPGLSKFMETKRISIHGRDIITSCSYDFKKTNIVTDSDLDNKRWLQTGFTKAEAHVLFTQYQNDIVLDSQLQPHDIHLFNGKDRINVLVCDGGPDYIAGGLQLDTTQLCNQKRIKINCDFKWPSKPLLLYRNSHINMYYKETLDANEH